LFGNKKIENKEREKEKVVEVAAKKSFITGDRARNIEMILQRRKIDLQKLSKACYSFDEEYLEYGIMMSLIEIHPLHTEIEIFQGKGIKN
jgi:type II restriction/modification system DNA methylase subunit YeeA